MAISSDINGFVDYIRMVEYECLACGRDDLSSDISAFLTIIAVSYSTGTRVEDAAQSLISLRPKKD